MRYVRPATMVALSILVPVLMSGQTITTQGMAITNYQVVSSQAVTRTTASYTFQADLVNPGGAMPAASATLGVSTQSIQMVSGQNQLHFSPVPANSQVRSSNTFTVVIDRTVPFSYSQFVWTFQGPAPIANAGPNQTSSVGKTVSLNGTGSSNPSGIGTLTYSWAFTSKPAGSTATLMNPASVTPSFVIDVNGTYLIQLTVNNGTASNSALVIVSTNNSPPVANAGPNQTAAPNSTVILNGAGSSDVDGDPLTYSWTLTSAPQGSVAVLAGANTVSPSFLADKAGNYTATLIVNDGFVNSAPSTVTISTNNTAPVANAGIDQVVTLNTLVHLDGSGSTDVDGNPLTYTWSLITLPTGSTATLSSKTAVQPTFTADHAGTYVAQLIVNDGFVNSAAATVTITTNQQLPPTANAGQNQTVAHHTLVSLSGSGTDPQNLQLTYTWALTGKPTSSTAVLSSTSVQNPTFFADLPGTYVAQLTVFDGFLSSSPATVTISTTNSAPIANAGSSQNVATNTVVTLNGSASSDPDSDPLTYSWSLTTVPTGSFAALTGATTVSPTFTPDLAGVYVAQLIVNDGFVNSTPVTVTITAQSITITPSPLNLHTSPGTLTVTISNAAGASGQVVALTSSNPSVATVPVNVTIQPSQTSATITVTPGSTLSSTTITGTATGFAQGTATVNVSASTPASITATGGTPQSATINTAFGTVLTATVKDASSNPVSGVVVTFAAPGSGASGTFAAGGTTATTNALGVAASGVFTANGSTGTYLVTASVTGVGTPASFTLTNTSGGASSITATGGTPQSAAINTAFGTVLTATVKDSGSNPVSGVVVTFAAPAFGRERNVRGGRHHGNHQCFGVATSGVVHGECNRGQLHCNGLREWRGELPPASR